MYEDKKIAELLCTLFIIKNDEIYLLLVYKIFIIIETSSLSFESCQFYKFRFIYTYMK